MCGLNQGGAHHLNPPCLSAQRSHRTFERRGGQNSAGVDFLLKSVRDQASARAECSGGFASRTLKNKASNKATPSPDDEVNNYLHKPESYSK